MSLKPLRDEFGEALLNLGKEKVNVVALDADLSKATRTTYFKNKFPERFFDVGIAEANMISMAAGLSTCNLIPFACTFSFLIALRTADQVRSQICYPNLNVKLVGTNGGLTGYGDGATHQCLKDIAVMRAMPNMTVVVPSDAQSIHQAVQKAAEHVGPVFLRIPRVPGENVHGKNERFEIGKGLKLKSGIDLTIIATGLMVSRALQAAEKLTRLKISVEVIEIHTLKPLDKDLVIESAAKTGAVVTVEEHSVYGGLFSSVCEVLSNNLPVPVEYVAVEDKFGASGSYEELLEAYGLTAENIILKAQDALRRKRGV